ncbi:hypothetical protein RvY_05662 [Ramazzottius varieornatus]|uniref:Uncharacterized protein n=1 Tax=Ramazzottius varieornatus TaxID=947166 RepID=A0A1D1UZE4_RAMVA|nr:hypothetical protein RvY_05662 [Ramazzottius varieornatus]
MSHSCDVVKKLIDKVLDEQSKLSKVSSPTPSSPSPLSKQVVPIPPKNHLRGAAQKTNYPDPRSTERRGSDRA